MKLMTNSSSANATESSEERCRRREIKLERAASEVEALRDVVRRRLVRLEILEELEQRGRFGFFHRR